MTDEELRRLQGEHGPALIAFLARRIPDAAEAAALYNQVLEVIWRRSGQVPDETAQIRMWMFGIAAKLAANHRRASLRRLALTERLARELSIAMSPSEPDELLEVRAAILALPTKQRDVVTLVHWEGLTLEQVGQVLGIPSSTARGRYQSARMRLAAALSELRPPIRSSSESHR